MQVKRVLVIGGAGFWGMWLVDALVRSGNDVTALRRSSRQGLRELSQPQRWIDGDIGKLDLDFLDDFDVVYYLAGRASVPLSVTDPLGDLDDNVRALVRVLAALKESAMKPRLIYASSAAVYGTSVSTPMAERHPLKPMSPYGVAKLSAESYISMYAQQFGVRAASARPFSIYGPGQTKQVVYDLSKRISAGERPLRLMGNPKVSRDFIHVSDASKALEAIERSGELRGEAFNIASGTETTLEELANTLLEVAGSTSTVEFSGAVREGEPERWHASIAALRSIGFEPSRSLRQGLAETYDWVQQTSTRSR